MNKLVLTSLDIYNLTELLEAKIEKEFSAYMGFTNVYAVPRGGIPVAYLLNKDRFRLVDTPEKANIIIDDIIDSGATKARFEKEYPGKPFFALIDKKDPESHGLDGLWIVFPWEDATDTGMEDNIRRILQAVDPNPDREGLQETPKRVAKAWEEWTSGYDKEPGTIFKEFTDGAEESTEMVVVRGIPFYSHCEHHLAPFFGTASIGYIPNGKIVGLSKLARLVDMYAKRLQVQERMTTQIAQAIVDYLNPHGVGVYVKARHLCMESRGIAKQGSETITTAVRGSFMDNPSVKSEFLRYL